MDINNFSKMKVDDFEIAYNVLIKAMRIIFSGSIDPLINKIDYKKINQNHSSNRELNNVEHELMEELKECKHNLEKK